MIIPFYSMPTLIKWNEANERTIQLYFIVGIGIGIGIYMLILYTIVFKQRKTEHRRQQRRQRTAARTAYQKIKIRRRGKSRR